MPSSERILDGLNAISNAATLIAVFWHFVVVAGLVAAAAGWRPSRRLFAFMLLSPFLSVAVGAWSFGNPFNGSMFLLLVAALGVIGLRLPSTRIAISSGWSLSIGALMVCFGLFYPHFLNTGSPLTYLYAAPTGLIPCPTLSLVIGFTLIVDGVGALAWSLILAGVGLFYGLFGIIRLGVHLDFGLVMGALALLASNFRVIQAQRPFGRFAGRIR